MLADPVTSALRQAGISDSVARMAGLPVSGAQGADYRSLGIGGLPGLNSLAGIPGMQGLAAQGLIPGGNGRGFMPTDTLAERTKQANEQVMEMIVQQMGSPEGRKPGFALPYQVVPASVAAKNPAVENPMPMGGLLNPPNSPLTPLPQVPITTPTIR
jgi:hypothetical protein